MSKYRSWCFTVNNFEGSDEDEVLSWIMDPSVRYICCGKEIGESGTPHLQGYVEFKDQRTLGGVRNHFGGKGHWEKRQGTPKQARDYIAENPDKPNPDFFEHGELPVTKREAGEMGAEERWEAAKAGRFEELAPESYKIYQYIYNKFRVVDDRDELDNIWIFGPSGCGKSKYCRANFPGFYTKGINKWWDGYEHEDVVVIDDLEPRHAEKSGIGYYLKIWGDHYAFNAEVKGGMLKIRPKKMIVTSQYLPNQVFPDFETLDAICRRFKVKTIVNGTELVDYEATPRFVKP